MVWYERPFLKLHALNSRKIQISCSFLFAALAVQCCQKICDPAVFQTRGSIRFTYIVVIECLLNTYECTIVHLLTVYICMYIHKKRLLYANKENFQKTKNLWHFFSNVCFDVWCQWCHASKLDWSTVTLLSNVKKQYLQIDVNVRNM